MPEERIQKVLANAGVASRRASDALVAAGRVRIDGRTAAIGERVDPTSSVIEVDGIEIGIGVARAYVALARVLRPAADPELAWYRATLRQGWKRQLRRMFGAVGAPVDRLVRVAIGPVPLGDLRSGRARRLTPTEIARLR